MPAKPSDYSPKAIAQGIGSVIPEWTKELGKDGDYVFSGTSWHYKLKYPGNDKIIKAAKEKYKEDEPPLYFGFGYAWMQTLQLAVEGAKSLDQTKIRDWLKSHEVKTIAGNFKFDEKGVPQTLRLSDTGHQRERGADLASGDADARACLSETCMEVKDGFRAKGF